MSTRTTPHRLYLQIPSAPDEADGAVLQAMFEQSPFSTVIYDAAGRVLSNNAAFRAFWGVGLEDVPLGYSVLADPDLEKRGILPYIRRAFDGETVVTPPVRYDISKVSTTHAGRAIWTEGYLFPVRDAAGRLSHVVLNHLDVTLRMEVDAERERTQRRARDLLSLATALSEAATLDEVADAMFREGLRAVGADAGSLALVSEVNGEPRYLSITRSAGYSAELEEQARFIEVTRGRPLSDAIISRLPVLISTGDERISRYPNMPPAVAALGYEAFAALPVVIGDRAVAGISFSFRGPHEFDDDTRTLLATIGQVCAQALDRARSFDAECRARTASQFLAEASSLLASSLDYETTLQNLAAAAVPRVADWCAIDIIVAPDQHAWPPDLRRVGLAHEDPQKIAWGEELRQRLPKDWASDTGLPRVLRDGVSELIPDFTEAMLQAAAKSPEQLALLRELQLSSVIIVPLTARGRVLGALTLVMAESGRRYDAADLAVAEDLGRRAATAIDNATLYVAAVAAQRAAERAADRIHRLQSLTASFASALTESGVLDVVAEQGIVAVGAQAGIVMLLSDDGSSLRPARAVGCSVAALERPDLLLVNARYPARDVIVHGQAIFLSSVADWNAAFDPPIWPVSSTRAAVMLPLDGSSGRLGLLALCYEHEREFDDDERDFLIALARQCGQALERAHLLRAERTARSGAEQANQAKMEFLETMSRELRTSLYAIGGYAELLQMGARGAVTDAQRMDLGRIQHSQGHLLSLINDVLNFAKLEAGRVDIVVTPVDVQDMLRVLASLVAPQLAAKHLTFDTAEYDPGVRVLADDDKLRQVLLNLLSNAVKFTADGGRIMVSCEADASSVRIAVCDTGIGIEHEHLARIFDPFVQLERRLTSIVSGTGLGLAISRDLARAMGGNLTAESEPGVGSAFTLHLRRAP